MAGKRIVDFVALFNAARGVAEKHVALRARQVDVYNRTSTLAWAVRSQTERVTERAKAASFLLSRLNEDAPAWARDVAQSSPRSQAYDQKVPSRSSTEAGEAKPEKGGLEQDHFYERSKSNSTVDETPKDDLDIQQEKAGRYPLPNGTIPPQDSDLNLPQNDHDYISKRPTNEPQKQPLDGNGLHPSSSDASSIPSPSGRPLSSDAAKTLQGESELQIPSHTTGGLDESIDPLEEGRDEVDFYRKPEHISPTLSSLPRFKIPKHVSSIQEGDEHLPEQLNSDTFYHAGSEAECEEIPSKQAVPEQEQIPEGVNTEIFHSPRVAKLLGGKLQGGRKPGLDLKGVKGTPVDHTSLNSGKDQDTFNVQSSDQESPISPSDLTAEHREAYSNPSTTEAEVRQLAEDIGQESHEKSKPIQSDPGSTYELRESKVPSSRLGRLWNYGGLAAGVLAGAVSESLRRVSGSGGQGSYMLSAGNMDRLVTKLSRMRGAALKLGQMLSFQDSKLLPAPIQEVLQRVQDCADYMPPSQRNKVLAANLGADWRDLFGRFEEKPLAAASIGQVHAATLKSTGARVAVKVQYPGVADSIDSDLNNLAILLTASRLLPKGLFLDKTIANARTELAWECDYIREAECGKRFKELLADEKDVFLVPKVYAEASGKEVLTMEYMSGIGVTRIQNFTQEQRDWIGTQLMHLCLREITEFKYMQTDPNWTNFLYNASTNKLELLDFGASREYPTKFITEYSRLLVAASKSDKTTVRDLSISLGYLTGQESKAMTNAHIASVLTLAEPFLESSPGVYDFRDQTITERVKALIPLMLKERLRPPPEETYSLHRKLSGAFLLCARLGSRVRCRELFVGSMTKTGFMGDGVR